MKWYIKVFQNYANFNGRASRSEYWYFFLFFMLLAILIEFVAIFLRFEILYIVYIFVSFIPAMAVGVRRMHDVNKSGWFILIPIYSLILTLTEGTRGRNDYGPDPLRPEADFDFENEHFAK